MYRRITMARYVLWCSGLVFSAATACMALEIEPFHSWYYCFAWWPFILGGQSVLALRGRDGTLFHRPWDFFLLAWWSLNIWLVFEAFNFRLQNWHYLDLPASMGWRWLGYVLSFSTVLPGIFTVREILSASRGCVECRVKPLGEPSRLYAPMLVIGALMLILPLMYPRFFFPLIWGGFVLLLEPAIHRFGNRGLLRDWQLGDASMFFQLLASGAVCGFLWELWNYWSGAKWYYTVPFVGHVKLFEMPVLGFLGFPPFAVECFVMAGAIALLRESIGEMQTEKRRLYWAGIILLSICFDILVFRGIDAYTVVRFAQ